MLAELTPKPDQVTVTVNTSQMNILEQMEPERYRRYLACESGCL